MPEMLQEWPEPKATNAELLDQFMDGQIYRFNVADARGLGIDWLDGRVSFDQGYTERRIIEALKSRLLNHARTVKGPYQTRTMIVAGPRLVFQFTGPQQCRHQTCVATADAWNSGYCFGHEPGV